MRALTSCALASDLAPPAAGPRSACGGERRGVLNDAACHAMWRQEPLGIFIRHVSSLALWARVGLGL